METHGKVLNIRIGSDVCHWPTLRTVLVVEKTIRDADGPLSLEGLKRELPKKIMDQTLRLILSYLESRGSIIIGRKGISWIENNDPRFLRMLEKSRGIEL